jgi:hypothetical protein
VTTTTTTENATAHAIHRVLPPAPHLPWMEPKYLLVLVPVVVLLLATNRRLKHQTPKTGGDGKVIGIVGRMGSGKSYFAIRMALARLRRGANVVTNFSMNLEDAPAVNELRAAKVRKRRAAKQLGMPLGKVKVLWGVTGSWRKFRGWEQFAELEDAVVIIDEAHLYAPGNKSLTFPDVARFKMSQARKFRLDVIWLSQHENRVNSVLKDLTNMMYVCRAWFAGMWFSVTGYEPEKMRRKNQHLERLGHRFNIHVARLYNTLEILDADESLMGSDAMKRAHEVSRTYNERHRGRCEHEQRAHKPVGWCQRSVCVQARAGAVVA